jgi:2,4-diketo-3-deoxy-L-fuconate hydrolase
MRLATFEREKVEGVGAVVDIDGTEAMVNLAVAEKALAKSEKRPARPEFTDMLALLGAGPGGRTAAKNAVKFALAKAAARPVARRIDGQTIHTMRAVKLRAPVPRPRKVFCIAGNFQDHIEEGGGKMEVQDKETPRVFMKPPSNTVIGPGDRILIPPVAKTVDWEGELAVVIGRNAKGVKRKDALNFVAGYTVMNDVSERKLKIKKRTEGRPRDEWFDWLNGKWLDTFAPQGPWIVTSDEIRDPQKLEISTFVNDERKQHNSTAQMLYPVAGLIEYISAIITLEPGDLISTGTISGVGASTGTYLKPGDAVKVEITGIGALSNKVAASKK